MSALIEPFFYCLFASIIWAPLIFFCANRLVARDASPANSNGSLGGKVWPVALLLAALPVIAAPIAASLGLSLRAPEAPLPPMADISVTSGIENYELAAAPITEPATTVSLADIMRTAAFLYFYGFLMLLALAVVRHIWFAYRLNYAELLDEPKLEAKLDQWRLRIGITQKPRYVFSNIVSSVCVYGFFRPVIVLPYNLLDRVSIDDAALMGAHEMAHVKRGDVPLFALCSVAKAIFWFNPFMHRICAQANLAAEQGADALVLARGVDRKQYAHCFVQGLRLAADATPNRFTGELVPSFTPFDKRSRRARLDAILSGTDSTSLLNGSSRITLAIAAIAATGLAFAQAAFAVSPPPAEDALPIAPVEGRISLGFGEKSKLLGEGRKAHEGVDIRAERGTPVLAPGDGKVIDATARYNGKRSWGKVVVIDHGHGLITRYAHLDDFKVSKGERVKAGEVIGVVGSTGKATGPHLHFEVIKDGEYLDPTPVIAGTPAETFRSIPKVKSPRKVTIAPMPHDMAVAPDASVSTPHPVSPAPDTHFKNERKLEKRLAKLEDKMRERFADFDAFADLDDIVIHVNDIELEGIEGAETISEMLDGKSYKIDPSSGFQFGLPDGRTIAFNTKLSAEDRREVERAASQARAEAAEQARASARKAQHNAEKAYEQANIRARKEAIKAQKRAKAEAIRVQREAEKARQKAIAALHNENYEHALEQIERETEMEFERAEREIERAERDIDRAAERFEQNGATDKTVSLEIKRAEQEIARAERIIERAERDFERVERKIQAAAHKRAMARAGLSEAEALEHEERALREAKENIDRQLAELKKRKRALNDRKDD